MIKQGFAAVALIAVISPQIASAASLDGPQVLSSSRAAIFAGPRVQFGFGGGGRPRVRGGFTLTGTQTTLRIDGSRRTRFGEGLWLGLNGRDQPALSIAGRPVGDAFADKRRNGLSKGGKAAVLVGGVLLAVAIVGFLYADHALDNDD